MGLARCERCDPPRGTKQEFAHPHTPISYPDNRVVCATPSCAAAAHLWLNDEEEKRYQKGERIFKLPDRRWRFGKSSLSFGILANEISESWSVEIPDPLTLRATR